MITEARLRDAEAFVQWIRVILHGRTLPSGDRARAAGSCFAIAQEHHAAIVRLVAHRMYASSLALIRVEFEAYVRGLWLSRSASEEQATAFILGSEPPKIGLLLEAVEATPGFDEGVLSWVKREQWDAMCAFTHTGGLHVQRWITAGAIEPNYDAEEIASTLRQAALYGGLAAIGTATLMDDDVLGNEILEKFRALS